MEFALAAYAITVVSLLAYGLLLSAERSRLSGRSTLGQRIAAGATVGLIFGCFVAILLRPSVPLVGQLPLEVVFSQGSTGEQILVGEAKKAFNFIAAGSLLGAAAGGLVVLVLKRGATGPAA